MEKLYELNLQLFADVIPKVRNNVKLKYLCLYRMFDL